MTKQQFFKEIISKILNNEIKKEKLESWKSKLSKKYNLDKIPKNSEVIEFGKLLYQKKFNHQSQMTQNLPTHLRCVIRLDASITNEASAFQKLKKFLQIKPVRTGSGVSVIAVMAMGDCPGKCIYCPRGENAPQSYTGVEPATMRAKRAGYDPYRQVSDRINQFEITGHTTDKCELIIMGGTFPALPKTFQMNFVKRCFDAFNNKRSRTLKQAMKLNEKARHRCVGLTIETRPDYCKKEHINQMLNLGCTRVELGVQNLNEKILNLVNRGHKSDEVVEATRLLKDSGLKVCYHLMPGLTGLYGKISMKEERKIFDEIFSNLDFRPDLLKIYPTLVMPGTNLYELWKKRAYKPITIGQTTELILYLKKIVPKWVRIQRVQRDISSKKIAAGPILTNLRQMIHEKIKKQNITCSCIRCREVGHQNKRPEKINFKKLCYEASGSKEYFLSYEDSKNNILVGYLRLRIAYKPFRKELKNIALVRELHVYGEEVPLGLREKAKWQHKGYGKKLLEKAEKIAKQNKMKKIAVTSGVGVRNYYRKFDYKLVGTYMTKNL